MRRGGGSSYTSTGGAAAACRRGRVSEKEGLRLLGLIIRLDANDPRLLPAVDAASAVAVPAHRITRPDGYSC
jgi:hypothetical protein